MPTNSYDLVVLGDDLAALVCATLCARRGMRTLVLGDDRSTASIARYTLGPHKLPVEPATWPVTPSLAADRVLKELHGELAMRRKLREPKVAAQIVAPDFRIDLGADRLAAELDRELGKAGADWLGRWDKASELSRAFDPIVGGEHAFPGVGFFEKREVAKLVDQSEDAAAAWWAAITKDPANAVWAPFAAAALRHPNPSPIAIARAFDAWRAGPTSLRGDGDAIRELFIEKLTTAGGEVRIGKVTDASVSWGKITSLTLQNGDELGAGQVASSRPPAELIELLGKKAPKRLHELAESVSIVGYRYTLNIVVDEAGLPEHMAPTVAVIHPGSDPVGDAAFTIHLGDADDGGRVVATIATVLPTEGAVEPERLAARCASLRTALWRRLDTIMPFFERHLVLAHSPFEPTPPQVPGGRGSYDVPKAIPLAMAPVWRGELAQTAGIGGLTYTTGLKNLTLTGDGVLTCLGTEGALVSGWSAAKVVCAIAGKKKDYLRDEVVGAAS